LPRAIYSLLAIAVILISPRPQDIDPQNAFFSNPGALMDPQTAPKFLYAVAGGLDIFVIWVLILVAIGLKAAGGRKLSFGGALFAVVLPYVVWMLARASLSAAGLMG
jgi:hypothetical protein